MTHSTEFWRPGTQILWQYKSPRGLPWLDPMTVVRDDSGGLVAWLAAGTETLQSRRVDGRDPRAVKSELFTSERIGVRADWKHTDVLRIAPAGVPWSVWLMWDCVTHAFQCWYGNIEAPLRRDGDMVLTRDYTLDVVVTPDRKRSRKDEDELELALQAGWYSQDEVDWIIQSTSELESIIDAWGSPFGDGWESFTPDPSWPVPVLPAQYLNRPRADS
jgi:hypothetical protein